MMRIAVVEDDQETLEDICREIDSAEDMMVVARATTCLQARESFPQSMPDVVVVDLVLPDGSGSSLIVELRGRIPNAEYLVLSAFEDYDRIYRAILAGATGYLGKAYGREELPRAIAQVHAGGSPMSGPIARKVLQAFHAIARKGSPFEQLSQREQEILHVLVTGKRYQEIADSLCISIETVRTHIRNIYKKLQVSSRAELLRKHS